MTQVFLTNASSSPWATPPDFPTPSGTPHAIVLHFDGADTSTTIIDSTAWGNGWSVGGNAQLDTAQQKFGTASALFDGTGDYIIGNGNGEISFGTGDFTIHCWVRPATNAGFIFDWRPASTFLTVYQSGTIKFNNGADQIESITTATSLIDTWYHLAITRASGTTRLFINGVKEGVDYTDTTDYTVGTTSPALGISGGDLSTNPFNGHIDEFVVIKGEALWTSSFTPPSSATTVVEASNVVELVGCGGSGANGTTGTSRDGGSGGGGGAYQRRVNLTLSGDNPFRVPAGAGNVTTRFGNDGTTGTNYFGAQFGVSGVGQSGGAAGGAGGSATEETGGTPPGMVYGNWAGGQGGSTVGNNLGGSGGGGAAGASGTGKAGGTPAAEGGSGGGGSNGGASTAGLAGAAGAGGNGGQGTSGSGSGAGGAAGAGNAGSAGTVGGGGGGSGLSSTAANPGAGGNGGSDTSYDGTHGAGGGGGGCGGCSNNSARNFVSGNGANYGGGGGGRGGARGTRASDTGGTGAGGLIVITYTPGPVATSLIFDPGAFFRPFIVR